MSYNEETGQKDVRTEFINGSGFSQTSGGDLFPRDPGHIYLWSECPEPKYNYRKYIALL